MKITKKEFTEMFDSGYSESEMAAEYSVSVSTIKRRAVAYGFKKVAKTSRRNVYINKAVNPYGSIITNINTVACVILILVILVKG